MEQALIKIWTEWVYMDQGSIRMMQLFEVIKKGTPKQPTHWPLQVDILEVFHIKLRGLGSKSFYLNIALLVPEPCSTCCNSNSCFLYVQH